MYIKIFSQEDFALKVKIVNAQLFVTPPYFCWQLAFYWHLPTLGRENTVKKLCTPFHIDILNPECIRIPWHVPRKIGEFQLWRGLESL